MKVSVVGCSLMDELYTNVDFSSAAFAKYASRRDGDGGLTPGKLVFGEDLAKFAGDEYDSILAELTLGVKPAARNLGGPAVVAAVHAAQMLRHRGAEFEFYGAHGGDERWRELRAILEKTPLGFANYREMPAVTPCSDVLSDPRYHQGKGERTFICTLGAAGHYGAQEIGEEFFDADVLLFGATALVPMLHDHLGSLLKKGREKGCVNVVSTVFDFRNEQRDPVGRWPLGESDETYQYIDLLVVDFDEAHRLSGERDPERAAAFFRDRGVGALVITHGAEHTYAWSSGRLFAACPFTAFPVSPMVGELMAEHPELRGDTTGCGDNFAGGMLAATVEQLMDGVPHGKLDLVACCAWAGAAGGFTCFCVGGTYLEKTPGEKRAKVEQFFTPYRELLAREFAAR